MSYHAGNITSGIGDIVKMLLSIRDNNKEHHLRIEITDKEGTQPVIVFDGKENEYDITFNKTDNNNDFEEDATCALLMSGLLELRLTFTESSNLFPSKPNSIRTSGIEFDRHLSPWMENRTLVPDTNALINHTLSSLNFITRENLLEKTKIMIPRLAILELERRANTKSECKKKDKGNKNSSNQEELKKKRESFLGFSELMLLKYKKSELFPDLDDEILSNFTKIASDLTADSWIRKEIKSYPVTARRRKEERGGSSMVQQHRFLLVTSDFVNSLASIAENIDTIYVSKLMDNNKISTNKAELSNMENFLIVLSTISERIYVSANSTKYQFTGFWKGKTTEDLIQNRIKIDGPIE